eukprot:s5110_g2.t1
MSGAARRSPHLGVHSDSEVAAAGGNARLAGQLGSWGIVHASGQLAPYSLGASADGGDDGTCMGVASWKVSPPQSGGVGEDMTDGALRQACVVSSSPGERVCSAVKWYVQPASIGRTRV